MARLAVVVAAVAAAAELAVPLHARNHQQRYEEGALAAADGVDNAQAAYPAAAFLEAHARGEAARAWAMGDGDEAEGAPPAGDGGTPPAGDGAAAPAAAPNACEVCTYVLENKEMLQPYLCRGLKEPAQQITVRWPRCIVAVMAQHRVSHTPPPPPPSPSTPAVRQGTDVAYVVAAQRGVLGQLRLPDEQGRVVGVGAPLPAAHHLQLDQVAGQRQRAGVLPRRPALPQAAMRRRRVALYRCCYVRCCRCSASAAGRVRARCVQPVLLVEPCAILLRLALAGHL